MLSFIVLSFRSLSVRPTSLFVLCDDIVLLEDVIGRRLFKALLPRISVLFVRIAGLPAVNIESPVGKEKKGKKESDRKLCKMGKLNFANNVARVKFNNGKKLNFQSFFRPFGDLHKKVCFVCQPV